MNEVTKSVDVLRKTLSEDPSYYESWKANIAMAFKDEFARTPFADKDSIHEIANKAADNFLKLLIG